MYCLSCGKEIPDGSRFCQQCGASQDRPAISEPVKNWKKSKFGITAIIIILIVVVDLAALTIYKNSNAVLPSKDEATEGTVNNSADTIDRINDKTNDDTNTTVYYDINDAEQEGIKGANIIVPVRRELTKCLDSADIDSYMAALDDYVDNKDIYDYSYIQLRDACNKLDPNAVKLALTIEETYPTSKLAKKIHDYLYGNPDLMYKSFLIGKWECIGNNGSVFENSVIEIKLEDGKLVGKITSLSQNLANSKFYTYSTEDVLLKIFTYLDDGTCTCDIVEKSSNGASYFQCTLTIDVNSDIFSIVNPQWPNLSFKRVE